MADKKLLLLIEDNPLLVGMYKTAFEKEGVAVLFSHNGEAALQTLKEHKPDLILLDLLMPGMSGFEILKQLRSDPETKEIKVVVLTVVTDKKNQEKAKKLGVLDYLIKSDLKLQEIVERVMKYFD